MGQNKKWEFKGLIVWYKLMLGDDKLYVLLFLVGCYKDWEKQFYTQFWRDVSK